MKCKECGAEMPQKGSYTLLEDGTGVNLSHRLPMGGPYCYHTIKLREEKEDG